MTTTTGYRDSSDDERGLLQAERESRDLDSTEQGMGTAEPKLGPPVSMDRRFKRVVCSVTAVLLLIWVGSLVLYIRSTQAGSLRKIKLDHVLSGHFAAEKVTITWIAGAEGEDGLILEQGAPRQDYLVVKDIRQKNKTQTLMRKGFFSDGKTSYTPSRAIASPDLKKVLLASDSEKTWRHSFLATYWILDVASQKVEPLDASQPSLRVQLAQWSPRSNAVVYTRENNLYVRQLDSKSPVQITTDGGPEYFYGIPDWVYEEEVLGGNSATWWSDDGDFLAFLRTNETLVPNYPLQYFIDRPSGTKPKPGMESYPEVRQIKYPKPGAPNPFVDLLLYDVAKRETFSVDVAGGFPQEDRLITEVVWAGTKVLIKETNRVSDVLRVSYVDAVARTGKTIRSVDVGKMDGGWFEISQHTRYIPADPANGRAKDGYIDSIIHDDGDHLAYYSPPDAAEPVMLTSGRWEVDGGTAAVDLQRNLVYFLATKESSVQRHVYSVKLDGTGLTAVTNTSTDALYQASFSAKAGYLALSYNGPDVPWQKILSTPGSPDPYERTLTSNEKLAKKIKKFALPSKTYGTISVDGFDLNYVERRPPHFDADQEYPVLFWQYSGPGSQTVSKAFGVDFQTYVAASLGAVVVTVDGRGTGFIGRKARVCVRNQLGHWEAHDQIAAAKIWAAKSYIDHKRIAIWGWSYGGYMALKTIEQDAGRTFRYAMAVAPVVDWRFYDSIYTERYMLTPQQNADGYSSSAVSNASALGSNVRFMIMHGVADDNVHMQNTLTLLDKLNLAGVQNYDLHMFPDSDHSLYFHGANKIVYHGLAKWLTNAFNREWLRIDKA